MSQMSKEYKAAWYQANKERMKSKRRENNAKNPEKVRASLAAYRSAHKDKIRGIQTKYREANSAYYVEKCAERYAKKTRATPAWANRFFIQEIYRLAELRTKMLGYSWHVDHIVPLRSKIVCGLHVEHNLQVIPGVENMKKHNSYWPDMP